MGRQWLQKNREINGAKRGKIFTKLLREITVAASMGLPDPAGNSRLATAVEAARKQSVPNDTISRAIKKGAGLLGPRQELETVTFEGFGPHKVAVIVECMTDNRNRTAPEIRMLFKNGQLGVKVGFLFEHVGIVEATNPKPSIDLETAAIESGAQSVEPLENTSDEHSGGRFITDRTDVETVASALRKSGWTVTAAEIGFVAKETTPLDPAARKEVEDFLEALDDNDDVHRIYTSLA